MLSISRQLLAVAVSAFALTAVPVAAAADDGPGPVDGIMTVDRIGPPRPPGPKGRYTITVNRTARVTLTCAPDGGTHQDPRAACRLLRALKGDPRGLTNGSESNCPRVYQPQRVRLAGTWRGRRIRFHHTYPNPCMLHAAGGPLW